MFDWKTIKEYEDILFEKFEGIAKITINRPKVYNAFRPKTNQEMLDAFSICRERQDIGVIILTGIGDKAFCSGGDQNVKGHGGYVGDDGVPRLNVLELHHAIRSIPKPVIAMVNGYSIGGGNVLQVVCDLSIASENARFGQTGPKVGSFDGGFGASYLARCVGQKKAREIWFLCKQYTAQEALEMGMVNAVVPFDKLEETTVEWARTILKRSPLAIRMIKRALNAELDGQHGLMEFAGDATLLYYLMDEAQEGKTLFWKTRSRFPTISKVPMRLQFAPYILKFKEPAGTSRGVLTEKPTCYMRLFDENNPSRYGVGEAAVSRVCRRRPTNVSSIN